MTRTSSSTIMKSTTKTESNLTKIELKKLKSILPTLTKKPTSTPIEIVLETIRYIRQLEDQLIDRYHMDTSLSGRNSNSFLTSTYPTYLFTVQQGKRNSLFLFSSIHYSNIIIWHVNGFIIITTGYFQYRLIILHMDIRNSIAVMN